ncbi:hypothetical protein [Nannocystis pusilla]|uniref:PEGA domain-containing protein n=1 Tax=Nannocystis pusilla TaxID=889268 RepID=A0ABS7U5N5_9BACT|nr:hypothetical protein [Nannocystis pusilla]MBZ5715774.1 hypothetical protein [Nannocystis pusilla]
MSVLLGGTVSVAGLPAYAQVAAEPSGEDVVSLKNGGMIRGKVLEVIPDESVTVESAATGERKTFPWAEVAGVERAGAPAAAEDPIAAEPPPAAGTRLHIETTRPADVQLFEITGETIATGYVSGGGTATIRGIHYRPVCTSPCDKVVDGSQGQSFFFGGPGVTTSKRFALLGQPGDLTAKVKPGRRGLRTGGVITMSVGFALAVAGGVLFAFAKPRDRYEVNDMNEFVKVEGGDPNYVPAVAVLVSGLALVAGGIAMYVVGRTRFDFQQRGLGKKGRLRLNAGGLTAQF